MPCNATQRQGDTLSSPAHTYPDGYVLWLVNVNTRCIEEFAGRASNIPPYAILSHTWGPDHEEISFEDIQRREIREVPGRYKFEQCCAQAALDGLGYVWIDTCCIDKKNPTELGEAINCMFKWFKSASICYVYLRDVLTREDPLKPQSSFWKSRWHQRGWTLQELIAPKNLRFFDSSWNTLGTKRDLASALVQITRVPREFLLSSFPLSAASVAQRMSWAAGRETSRTEDLAYCLLGIFDITMPIVYGEGEKAFTRLQEEIIKQNSDDSILAWGFDKDRTNPMPSDNMYTSGALAKSPADFAHSGHITPSETDSRFGEPIYTRGGDLFLKRYVYTDSLGQIFIMLQSQSEGQPQQAIGIRVRAETRDDHNFMRLYGCTSILIPKGNPNYRSQDIRIPIRASFTEDDTSRYHGFLIENNLEKDLHLAEVRPESSWNVENRDIILLNDETRYGRVCRVFTMFEQKDASVNFILVLELLCGTEFRSRHNIVTCSKGTELRDVVQNLSHIALKDLESHSASNGILDLKVTVTPKRVGKQDMYVVKINPATEAPDTYDVTNELKRLELQREITRTFQQHHQTGVDADHVDTNIQEKQVKKKEVRERLAQVDEDLIALRQVQHKLRHEDQVLGSDIGRLKVRADELGWQFETLWKKAEALHQRLDEQFPDPTKKPSKLNEETDMPVDDLLEKSTLDENERKVYGQIPDPVHKFLLTAARVGYEPPFRDLARRNIDINLMNVKDDPILAVAAEGGNRMIVQAILALGVDVGQCSAALIPACRRGYTDIVRLLLDSGARAEGAGEDGPTLTFPLVTAAQAGHATIVRILCEHGANPNGSRWDLALFWAVLNHNLAMVEHLLDFGADIDHPDTDKATPLMIAASSGDEMIIRCLLLRGADKRKMDGDGRTALDHCRPDLRHLFQTGLEETDSVYEMVEGSIDGIDGRKSSGADSGKRAPRLLRFKSVLAKRLSDVKGDTKRGEPNVKKVPY